MRAHGLFPAILRAIQGRAPDLRWERADPAELTWLIRSGLAPITWRLVSEGRIDVPDTWRDALHASDLVSRAVAHRLLRATEEILGWFRAESLPPVVLLRGLSVATRYYGTVHERAMGDVDVLLPAEAVPDAVRLLQERSFAVSDVAEPARSAPPDQVPRLTHPDGHVIVELHQQMLPPDAPTHGDAPFALASLDTDLSEDRLGAEPVLRMGPERELCLLAAAWAYDLSTSIGTPGLQRPLVDAVLLLHGTRESLDWALLSAMVEGSASGDCVWIMLSLLERLGALPVRPELAARLRSGRRRIDPASTRVVHALAARHVLAERSFGRVVTPASAAVLVGALMRPAPGWRRWLGVIGRLRSLVRAA